MRDRVAFGYVVAIDGGLVVLNVNDEHRGYAVSHRGGVAHVQPGAYFGVDAGDALLVLRARSLMFAEPKDAHRAGVGTTDVGRVPLRQLQASLFGVIRRRDGGIVFRADRFVSPALGAEAFPLFAEELAAVLGLAIDSVSKKLVIGEAIGTAAWLSVDPAVVLPRHIAVLGSSGQGKSCFVASLVQQVLAWPQPRVVVFDINGEYKTAFETHVQNDLLKLTVLGGPRQTRKLPYVALGRHGLARLLLPSERTQRPALNFALDSLRHVSCTSLSSGVAMSDSVGSPVLFDDCRPSGADLAFRAVERLRSGEVPVADHWPHMAALGCLIAESHATRQGSRGPERNAFEYGNVAPVVTRLRRLLDDQQFGDVVNVEQQPSGGGGLDWHEESERLVEEVFGRESDSWKLHLVDLSAVAHDLLPMVLGSLLELFAFELFRRGPGATYPTLLVLEEAHHYLRQVADGSEHGSLAYERLAKEGRKFGVSLLVSTQRPSEVSPTVLGQCSTWVVFRTAVERDLRAIAAAADWAEFSEMKVVAGLSRQHALAFGTTVSVPTFVKILDARPLPSSSDPDFSRWFGA